MKNKIIKVNGVTVKCFSDGSVEKAGVGGKIRRQFGSNHCQGYKVVGAGGGLKLVHRLIAEAFLDEWRETLEVDHIDGDKANNRVDNLRMVTRATQCRAHAKKRKGVSSMYRGVSLSKARNTFASMVYVGGKDHYLGNYETGIDAAKSYDAFAYANGYLKEALNFSVRRAQNLLLCTLAVANNK